MDNIIISTIGVLFGGLILFVLGFGLWQTGQYFDKQYVPHCDFAESNEIIQIE